MESMKSMKVLPSFSFDMLLGTADATAATSGLLRFTTLLLALSSNVDDDEDEEDEEEEEVSVVLLLGNGQDIEKM